MVHALHEVDAPSEIIELFTALIDFLIHLRLGEYSVFWPPHFPSFDFSPCEQVV